MLCRSLIALLLLAGLQTRAFAEDEYSILMQRYSEPGEAGELYVFVGEQQSYEPLDQSCERCWVFDTWHTARYRVAEWIHGFQPGTELEFDVAEHASMFPFGHSRYSLVFVERNNDGLALVKYQQEPVYPTEGLGFASCGPLDGGPKDPSKPLDPEGPELTDIVFAPKLVVDDSRRLSPLGRRQAHDPRWHEVIGDEVVCSRGVPVSELVPALVQRHETLRAALPEFTGATQ